MDRERRFVPTRGTTVRAGGSGASTGIAGAAAVFDRPATIGGKFDEVIRPGAFDDVVDADVFGLFNHDKNFVLGRTGAGTMELRANQTGLHYAIPKLPESRRDVLEAVERRDVTGNSFSFELPEDGTGEKWIRAKDRDDGGTLPLREIRRVASLHDVGPVTYPAYEATTVSARSAQLAEAIVRPTGRVAWLRMLPLDQRRRVLRLQRAAAEMEAEALFRERDEHLARLGALARARRREPKAIRRLCIHEAGHAVADWCLLGQVREVGIRLASDGGILGGFYTTERLWTSDEMLMAGAAAELEAGLGSRRGWGSDLAAVPAYRRSRALKRARRLLRREWQAVKTLAEQIESRGHLAGSAVERIVESRISRQGVRDVARIMAAAS